MADEQKVADAEFGKLSNTDSPVPSVEDQQANLDMIFDVPVGVTAELGRAVIRVKDLLNFSPGAVVELERAAGESIDLMVNGVLIGKGDVVVVNENFGLRITEIVSAEDRIRKLSS